MPELDVKEKELKEEAMRMATLIFCLDTGLLQDIKDHLDIEILYQAILKLFKQSVPYEPSKDNPFALPGPSEQLKLGD